MHSKFFLKSFRILLFPFAVIYWFIVLVRNWFYDKNIISSTSFGLPLICIGNLSVGGTGKSPMVEYLVLNLKDKFKVSTLSRGYKRKTTGYALADENSTALDIGDEPMQFHLKFPSIPVAVGEERLVAIPQLLHDRPDIQCIILDDAFQHRAVRAGLNILLTDYNNLFTRDFFLPTGDLRDLKSSYRRADIMVITKCPFFLTEKEKKDITEEIRPLGHQHVFFATSRYANPYHILRHNESIWLSADAEVLLVTGIANPMPLQELLYDHSRAYYMLHYPDHHIFDIDDWKEIKKRFEKIEAEQKYVLTTEKDAVRLVKFGKKLDDIPLYVIPLAHHFLFDEGERFLKLVIKFIKEFKITGRPETVTFTGTGSTVES